MTLIFRRGRDLYGFEVDLNNVPGALAAVTSVAHGHNLNIYYIEILSYTEDIYSLFFVLDFTGTEMDPQHIKEEIAKKKTYVRSVTISPMYKDVIFPSKFSPLYVGPSRAVILGEATLHGLIEQIRNNLGEEAGQAFLYQLGIGIGQWVYRKYSELTMGSVEDSIKLLAAFCRGVRWGDVIDYSIDDDKIIVRIKDLWECDIQKGMVNKPASHLVRGIIAGYAFKILGREVIVNETRCMAIGDPYCQFEVNIIT